MATSYIQKKQLKVLNILLIIFVSQYILVLVVGGNANDIVSEKENNKWI